jgi:lipoprotein-anchoring transpeptidase ErfK/SrfK
MEKRIDRRGFLRLAALSTGALAFRPVPPIAGDARPDLARVATTWIGLYAEPSFRSKRLARLGRDEILSPEGQETSDEGPAHNRLWFRLADGYAHSGNLQLVRWLPQTSIRNLPDGGGLFEVSVPYTRTHRDPDPASDPLYRLYYQSTHWVEKAVQGADGRIWYQIVDDILYIRYFAPGEHLRRVHADELSPISPEVPSREKRIEVSLARQELMAFEGERLVLRTRISSGIPDPRPKENGVPTITPDGTFHVTKKTPMRHMGDGRITADPEAYELPGVPWVSFFHETGVGFHGTYWHTDYGLPRSHGCVNMRPEEAKWLYRWSTPEAPSSDRLVSGYGTRVVVY